MERNRARTKLKTCYDTFLVSISALIVYIITEDREYWDAAPYPLHYFLIAQTILELSLIRVPSLF